MRLISGRFPSIESIRFPPGFNPAIALPQDDNFSVHDHIKTTAYAEPVDILSCKRKPDSGPSIAPSAPVMGCPTSVPGLHPQRRRDRSAPKLLQTLPVPFSRRDPMALL